MKPMLAHTMDKPATEQHRPGFYQPKLDGVRLIWTGTEAISRKGKPILGMPKLIKELNKYFKNIPLDGELYSHGRSFQSFLGSIRRTVNIEEDESVKYWVYDSPTSHEFYKRIEQVSIMIDEYQTKTGLNDESRIVLCPTFAHGRPITINEETVKVFKNPAEFEKHFVKQGFEGAMWRATNGSYDFGKRSRNLLKIKSFIEEEFEIIGVEKKKEFEKVIVSKGTSGAKEYADGRWWKNGEETLLNTLGALVCKTKKGKEFQVGSGFDDKTRQELYDDRKSIIGKMVTVKYFELTDDQIPRFPVYKAIRDYE